MTEVPHFPRIVLRGSPFERGEQYGSQARDRIARSIAMYRDVFGHMAQLSWTDAVEAAHAYLPSIKRFAPQCVDEMEGIAQGAGVALGDILALNARSELMFAHANVAAAEAPGECSSLALLPEVCADEKTLLAQNWDWIPGAMETAVLLEVHRDDGPNYLTLAEAGHLAKVGVNSAGLGVCTNTLVSKRDAGRVGVPYHVLLRALLDAENMSTATRLLVQASRAFSGNFLLAHRDGSAVNIETSSGDSEGARPQFSGNGVLTHTNHFLDETLRLNDARVSLHPGTLFRLDSLRRHLHGKEALSVQHIKRTLSDHKNFPESVCWHRDKKKPGNEQRLTVASVIMDLTEGSFMYTVGPPCESAYHVVLLDQAIGYPSAAQNTDAAMN